MWSDMEGRVMVQDRTFISLIITDELENTIECYDTKVYEKQL